VQNAQKSGEADLLVLGHWVERDEIVIDSSLPFQANRIGAEISKMMRKLDAVVWSMCRPSPAVSARLLVYYVGSGPRYKVCTK
jgi:hypothetical protein